MNQREEEQRRAVEEQVAAETALNVEVKDGVITITQPGTEFCVTYRWQPVATTPAYLQLGRPEHHHARGGSVQGGLLRSLAEATARERGWIA